MKGPTFGWVGLEACQKKKNPIQVRKFFKARKVRVGDLR